MRSATVEDLASIPLFSALEPDTLAPLARSSGVLRLSPGELLFQQGEPADRFFHVVEGQVKLFRSSPAGQEKIVEIIQGGQSFAEAVIFMDGKAFPVSSQALQESTLISVDGSRFRKLLTEDNPLCLRLLGTLSRRLHHHLQEIDALALQNARLRLVNYLLQQLPEGAGDGVSIELPAQKKTIAARLSLQPETYSRCQTQLIQAGVIVVEGSQVTIRDLRRLREFALGDAI